MTLDLYAIRRYSAWANTDELGKVGIKSAKVGDEEMPDRIRWIRSYIVKEPDERLGSICIYEAQDPEAIHEHARRVGMPSDEVYPIVTTAIIRPDPVNP